MRADRFDEIAKAMACGLTRRRFHRWVLAVVAGFASTQIDNLVRAQDAPPIESGTGAASRAGEAAHATEIELIALGDSIASGHGLYDTDGTACEPTGVACCHRSPRAYPYRVAAGLRKAGYDVIFSLESHHIACSGAATGRLRGKGGQTERAIAILRARPAGRRAVVTITAGADDFPWTDTVTWLQKVMRLEDAKQGIAGYHGWVDKRAKIAVANLTVVVDALLKEPDVSVLVTEYPNPLNRQSVFFAAESIAIDAASIYCRLTSTYPFAGEICRAVAGAVIQAACADILGAGSCYDRIDYAVNALNAAYGDFVTKRNDPRVRLAPIYATFAGHEAPKSMCGQAEPTADSSYVQYIGEQDVNSYIPLADIAKFGLGIPSGQSGDCFHPNDRGAAKYAEAVLAQAKKALAPRITAGPTVTDLSATTATISWSTDRPTDSAVDYGPTTSFGQTASDATLMTEHAVFLSDLEPGTTYHYRVHGRDAAGGTATTKADRTFTTAVGIVSGSGPCLAGGACETDADCCDPTETCQDGFCGLVSTNPSECAPGQHLCDGFCTDLTSDLGNCGQCGFACDDQQFCVAGVCQTSPPGGDAIVVRADGTVTLTALGYNDAICISSFGLAAPYWQEIFDDSHAQTGQSVTIGPFAAGDELVFWLQPHPGSICTTEVYLSTDPDHARVTAYSDSSWGINWEDLDPGLPGADEFLDFVVDIVFDGAGA